MNTRPLGFLGTTIESARQTVARLLRHRLRWIVIGGTAFLAGGSWLLGFHATDRIDGRSLFCILAWWVLGTVLMPWVTLYLGVQAVHGDLEDRTSLYLFVRPIGRVPLLLGKWLASALLGAAVGASGVLALYAGLAAHGSLWSDGRDGSVAIVFALVFAGGAVAYAAAAVLFSACFRRPLLWAAFFVVGLQQLTANLPVSAGLRQLTITDPMRRLVLDGIEPNARLAESLWPAETFRMDQLGTPWRDLGAFAAVVLVLAAWRYRRSEYESRERD